MAISTLITLLTSSFQPVSTVLGSMDGIDINLFFRNFSSFVLIIITVILLALRAGLTLRPKVITVIRIIGSLAFTRSGDPIGDLRFIIGSS